MQILLLPMMFAVLIFSALTAGTMRAGNVEVKNADLEIISYRVFMQTADAFVKANPAPGAVTSYDWDAITTAGAPGQQAAGINKSWRIVRAPDGKWAACTALSEMSVARLNSMFAGSVAPAAGASASGAMAGHRLQPASVPGGVGGALQLGTPYGPSGVIGIGTLQEAQESAGLCNQ